MKTGMLQALSQKYPYESDMFEDGSLVKHKDLDYEGLIDGQTNLKMLLTGNRQCEFQYRIKLPNQDKRLIAPEEDLQMLKAPIILRVGEKSVAYPSEVNTVAPLLESRNFLDGWGGRVLYTPKISSKIPAIP